MLPSLFVIPSLLIFVYLLFETTKLSREKIRQQFAVDSAAFIQMGDYTNLLNRTAYVNGPFPHRIFRERFACPEAGTLYESADTSAPSVCEYDIMYNAGAFPKDQGDTTTGTVPRELDKEKVWPIAFADVPVREVFKKNPNGQQKIAEFELITKDQGSAIQIPWPAASGLYQFYSQVYTLLGSVEASQWTVFQRLTESFSFFRKSYYLNAGTAECTARPDACGEEGLEDGFQKAGLNETSFTRHYLLAIAFHAKVYTGGFPSPYYLGKTTPAMDMTKITDDGLFQLATISDTVLRGLGKGLDVYQGWTAPKNYFNIDFNTVAACKQTNRPCVHARIATQCPDLKNNNNCVWPNPTPKYQTRLYP